MALSDREKQLLALEEELGLVPRRKLKTKIDVMQSDLKHAIQMAKSLSYTGNNKQASMFWQRQLEGMQKRSNFDW